MSNYRIKELDGVFTIQGSYTKTTRSYLIFKNYSTVWSRLNERHEPMGARNFTGARPHPHIHSIGFSLSIV